MALSSGGRLNVSLLKDGGGGSSLLVFAFVEDITERKRAEQALRESEDKLRLLLDSTAEAIYGIDLETNAHSATVPASALWDTSASRKCPVRICMN
jgi:PAS domain-containing protein